MSETDGGKAAVPSAPQASVGLSVQLESKIAVVTGAGSGIGAATASALANAGAKVLGVDRDADGLAQSAAAISQTGGQFEALALDLCGMDAGATVIRTALDVFGGIDVLVHSAGIWVEAPFAATDALEALDRQLAINLRAPHALTQAALPALREGGVVIFIASRSGVYSALPANSSGYCASKAAVWALARALSRELAGDGIRINVIAPGTVETPVNFAALADPDARRLYTDVPAGRLGRVEDIAASVLFLASDASSFYYGATFVPDGGLGVIC